MQIFKVGDTIRIKFGSFANFTGVVEKIDTAKSFLAVKVNIFGRRIAVEVPFTEAEKLQPTQQPKSGLTNLN